MRIGSGGERKTDGTSRIALQGPVHRAGVANEVGAGPRISSEELVRQHVAFQAIARRTRRDQVARRVRPALRHGVHVIERRDVDRQWNGAVDAASAAVTHGSVLERTLEAVIVGVARAAAETARCAGKRDSVETTSRHCTSLRKENPATGQLPVRGLAEREALARAPEHHPGFAGPSHECRRRSFIGLRGDQVARTSMQTSLRGMSAAYVPTAQGRLGVPCRTDASTGSRFRYKSAKRRSGASTIRTPSTNAWCHARQRSARLKPRSLRRQLAAASVPSRRAGSRMAVMIRAAVASRNVRSGISEPGKGSGMSNPSPLRRGIRCTW